MTLNGLWEAEAYDHETLGEALVGSEWLTRSRIHAEVAQLVEPLPSKQIVAGSSPVFRSLLSSRL